MKRILAFVLSVAMLVGALPAQQLFAADSSEFHYFELDTDGIDAGAQYLIVSAKADGDAYALKNGNDIAAGQSVTISGQTIAEFDNDASCIWTFGGTDNGTVKNGTEYLHIRNGVISNETESILSFAHFGAGTYGVYLEDATNQTLYYLRHDASGWKTEENVEQNASGNSLASYKSCVFLFKKITMQTVSYNGMGNTDGMVPETDAGLKTGTQYTVKPPSDNFLKIDEEGNVYLFVGWTTQEDGSGKTYLPGDTISIGYEDITLYAKWQIQLQYTITVRTNLDNEPTDVELIEEEVVGVYVSQDETPTTNTTYIELAKTATGTYVTTVNTNGTYHIYVKLSDGSYEQAHGHKVVIFNQNGDTILQNYSVTYDTGTTEGQPEEITWQENYHVYSKPLVSATIPKKSGYVFMGWKTEEGKILTKGAAVCESIQAPVVLTAVWEEATTVTVNLTIDHKGKSEGVDNSSGKADVTFQLLQWKQESGVNLPMEGGLITLKGAQADGDSVSHYTYMFTDMEQGDDVTYHVSTAKSGYEITSITTTREASGEYIIDVQYRYAPSNFDLVFDVQMESETPQSLYPQAVNVKVNYWGYNEEGELGWHIITQQAGDEAPTTVVIDQETGKGTAFYPVWQYWSDTQYAYEYRVEVTSYVLPDGRIVAVDGNDFYSNTVTIEKNGELSGREPEYPEGSDTTLKGAYYNGSEQAGLPTVTISATSYKVTFDAGTYGKISGQQILNMGDQYQYPNLNEYIPVANDPLYIFDGWYIGNTKAENLSGEYLTEDVTYTAKWKEPKKVSGLVYIDAVYILDGEEVEINERDRAEYAMVVLQKMTNNVYNDIESTMVEFSYRNITGWGTYNFKIPDDGAEYRIQVRELNYSTQYDNNEDTKYSDAENRVLFKGNKGAVDAHLSFTPESYMQVSRVDASQINKDYRPTGVLSVIDYRDLGVSGSTYQVISQHTVEPYGMDMTLNMNGEAFADYSIWKWHTDGMLYEYQLNISKLYGNVAGVFAEDGSVAYNSQTSPYTIRYGQSAWWNNELDGAPAIEATLIPKEYNITFDLNLGDGSNDTVLGMEQFITDDGNSGYYYSYAHTWSYEDDLIAFPYRDGYVFEGWINETESNGVYINSGGYITVGAGLAEEVTLKAQWKKLSGNCYTVRYLEKNTERVLHGAKVVENARVGAEIKAHDEALEISRYKYTGVMIDGTYYEWSTEPSMIVKSGTKNMMTIYYVPSDDGYTEQVESNLHLNKTATLEDDGTYTITMETYTKDNPVTTQILQNTPLDIVLVIDQSGSIYQDGYLDELQDAVDNFITLVADHGRTNEVDHRIAMVGYASDEDAGTTDSNYPFAGGEKTSKWVNTGVFDSNGDFHTYTVTGFNYTEYNGAPTADGTYYTLSDGKYLLLMHHTEYYHLITEEQAKTEALNDKAVYGYVDGHFVQVTRNHSGLWIYGNNQLYSLEEFFTYHQDVWTHRDGLGQRLIHAYGTGVNYKSVDGHTGLYTRTETTGTPQLNVYKDALVPVSIEQNGAGRTNPHLINASERLGSNGGTYVQYGIEMANKIFEANNDTSNGRVKIMVMFTDGNPGRSGFEEAEANAAIQKAYVTKNTYDAYCYTIGLYPSTGVSSTSDVSVYMNAVSSNYPNAQDMDDVYTPGSYYTVNRGTNINDGKTYYVRVRSGWSYVYLPLVYGTFRNSYGQQRTGWYYTNGNTNTLVTETKDVTVGSNGKISGTTIYGMSGGYKATDYSGYYSTTDSEANLKEYFANVMTEITTKITREIILHTDTIIRDIMGQGLVLTEGTVIKAYKQAGTYNAAKGGIDWAVDGTSNPKLEEVATLELLQGTQSSQTVEINGKQVSYIQVYNMETANATNPNEDDYHPHTVDITGYDFENWYISDKHPQGYKMVVEISRVEARDDVEWGRSTATNNEQSGLWLPADAQGNRELLLAFDQPKTIFVQRSYVLDYAKTFDLKGWYLDKVDGNAKVGPIHIDTTIQAGMNWFDKAQPRADSGDDLSYATATIRDKIVSYTPTNMNWHDVQEFYVFGNTENTTVTTQDANKNGNLWTKVNVLPANSIYYEDSFVTTESDGVKGFVYNGSWETVYSGTEQDANQNTETPEHQEKPPYGDVHGWIDAMGDDGKYSDGSAHMTGKDGTMGASVEFTFTGVGVDVYTRTNKFSGMIIATLSKIDGDIEIPQSGQIIDNLAVSGDYYHIPTLSFENLSYGTYKVKIFATAALDVATGSKRYEYYLDGIRVYSPLGENQVNASDIVKDAYAKEQNAVFKEVRDILLDYEDFNIDMENSTDGKAGAVFIDTIKEGQGTGNDAVGVGQSTYEVGTFETYGPKNEVYLKGGQSIVLKVDKSNTYYVGLKSLDGKKVTVNVSGISKANPQTIEIAHSIDMYYEVTPIEGYIVIENASTGNEILSITKLRTTNLTEPVINGGILPVTQQEAVMMMARFALRMNPPVYEEPEDEELGGKEPEEQKPVEKNPEENVQEKPDSGKKPSDNQIADAGNISGSQQTTDKKPNATPSEQNTLVDEETEEDIADEKESEEEETEEAAQEESDSEESEDNEKLTFWEKILAFFKNLLYDILTWISNLIGGEDS